MHVGEEMEQAFSSQGFTVIDKIGEGGFARAFRVKWDKYPDQIFVAKVIGIDSEERNRYESYSAEIASLKTVYHKNIIQFYHNFISTNYVYIIMEYCNNGTLADYISQNGYMNAHDFGYFSKQCLEALDCCHKLQIAHRDIKPTNIMITDNNIIKICDFGIAHQLIRDDDSIRRFDGSLMFSAPEMQERIPHNPKKCDIWAMGITFYYLVTGKFPWKYNERKELTYHILHTTPNFPQHVPLPIVKIIGSMIHKTPDSRPSAEKLLSSSFYTKFSLSIEKKNLPGITSRIGSPLTSGRILSTKNLTSTYLHKSKLPVGTFTVRPTIPINDRPLSFQMNQNFQKIIKKQKRTSI